MWRQQSRIGLQHGIEGVRGEAEKNMGMQAVVFCTTTLNVGADVAGVSLLDVLAICEESNVVFE